VLEQLLTHLRDRGIAVLVGVLITAAGGAITLWRARRRWKRREFLDRINVSLNMLIGGKLLIRTLIEKSCQDVFLNTSAVKTLLAAAGRTTPQNALLPLDKDDYWYFLNAVLNEISEKFSVGQLKQDLGQPVIAGRYLIALTFECAGDMKTRKIRAMVIRKDLLLALPVEVPEFTSPHHKVRWDTLHQMKAAYAKTPSQFLEIEICL
jgi:hypothetical protein